MNLASKHALVLGLGETGLSMARFLERRGARVRVADTRDDPPQLAALAEKVPQAELALGTYRDESFVGIGARRAGGRRYRAVRAGAARR